MRRRVRTRLAQSATLRRAYHWARGTTPGGAALRASDPRAQYQTIHAGYPVAVVGLGRQGLSLANALAGMGYQVVAGCEPDVTRRAAFQNAHPAALATDTLDALVATGPSVVVIATLSDVRAAIVEQLAAAGVRKIVSEKPIATTIADGRRIERIARDAGVAIGLHTPRSHLPEYQAIADMIGRRDLGDLYRIDLRFKSSGFGNIGSHFLPLAFELAGRPPVRVAEAWFDDGRAISRTATFSDRNGRAHFVLEGGVDLYADNRESTVKGPPMVTLTCTAGRITCRESAVPTWSMYDARSGTTRERRFAGGAITARGEAAVRQSLDRVIDGLINGEPSDDLAWAVAAVEAIVAAQLSHASRQPVSLPLADDTPTPCAFT